MKTKASMQSYHQNIASMFIALGIVVFLSALIINPWVGKLYRSKMINYHDVMLSYFIWAIVISILIVGTSLIFRSVSAYSGASWAPIPVQRGHRFRNHRGQ